MKVETPVTANCPVVVVPTTLIPASVVDNFIELFAYKSTVGVEYLLNTAYVMLPIEFSITTSTPLIFKSPVPLS